jgi:hypothetical protein
MRVQLFGFHSYRIIGKLTTIFNFRSSVCGTWPWTVPLPSRNVLLTSQIKIPQSDVFFNSRTPPISPSFHFIRLSEIHLSLYPKSTYRRRNVYLQTNEKRTELGNWDVTLKLWWLYRLRKFVKFKGFYSFWTTGKTTGKSNTYIRVSV